MHNRKPEELLRIGLLESGITPSDEQINAFMRYLSELKKWNKAYNLTGLKNDEDIIIKHFLDSLLYLKAMPDETTRVADIGTGAGFPGIPSKLIRPEIEMYLIEPSGKKAAFLRHIIWQLQLKKIEVIEKRIEGLTVNQALPFAVDIAVTRALFDVGEFIKKASPIVKPGGTLILNKGPKALEEIAKLKNISCELMPVGLPLSEMKRHLVIIRLNAQQPGL
jgi:16S rRNA (guanine527-N7)-methyltransferase